MIVLGIESSCDETAVAVVRDGREILSSVISSQVKAHAKFGGIVPELAARMHTEIINLVLEDAIDKASIQYEDIDLIAVTSGPGLMVSLVVGASCARTLGSILRKPVVGVNHLEAHILSNFLSDPVPKLPAVCLLVSGGHTELLLMKSFGEYEMLGATRDDAAGEAFDKVARLLGLPYPGGPAMSQAAESAVQRNYSLPRPMLHDKSLDFSFSGLKTAVVTALKNIDKEGQTVSVPDMAAEFQDAAVHVLSHKAMKAAQEQGAASLLLCGGVAANKVLRANLEALARKRGLPFFCPPISLCTDNAAMVACAGYHNYRLGNTNTPLSPKPDMTL